jgi:hypothetical protein
LNDFKEEFSIQGFRTIRDLELIYKTNAHAKYSGGILLRRIRVLDGIISNTEDILYEISSFNKLNTKLSSHSLRISYQNFLNAYYRFSYPSKFEPFSKIFAELKSSFLIANAKKIRTRLFAGFFINNHNRNMLSDAADKFGYSYWGNNDYTFSDTYINRRYDSRQTYINDGGVRNRFDSYLTNTYNMLAFNSSVDILKGGLISVYFDAAYSKTRYPFNEYSTYNYAYNYPSKYAYLARGIVNHNIFYIASGIRIALIPDYVEFYLPFYLYETIDGKRAFKDTWENVNILINLTKLNPFDAARKAYD